MRRVFYALILALILSLTLPAALAGPGSSPVQELCGKWNVGFNWPDSYGYTKSISQGNSESGGARITTNSLVLTSKDDAHKTIKIDVAKYSTKSSELSNSSNLKEMAKAALTESGSCGSINMTKREVDGKPGIFAIGEECKGGRTAYAAVYPIDYSFDRTTRAVVSSALCTVVSTFDLLTTEDLVNSIHVERSY